MSNVVREEWTGGEKKKSEKRIIANRQDERGARELENECISLSLTHTRKAERDSAGCQIITFLVIIIAQPNRSPLLLHLLPSSTQSLPYRLHCAAKWEHQ